MGKYFDMLMEDVRMKEGLTACMNCGICTGVCPAAEFYNYDPRQIVNMVQTKDDDAIEKLLKSDTIWYCGECMSCRPRCPRGNTPGYIIQSLRTLSQKLGFFTESEKGRQQTHHRAEYPDVGLLRQAEFRRSGSTSRTGAGMAVDPRQRQRRLRTFRRQLLQGRRRSRTQDRRPQHGGDPQHFRSDRGYAFFREHRNVLG